MRCTNTLYAVSGGADYAVADLIAALTSYAYPASQTNISDAKQHTAALACGDYLI